MSEAWSISFVCVHGGTTDAGGNRDSGQNSHVRNCSKGEFHGQRVRVLILQNACRIVKYLDLSILGLFY